jgi:predicted RNase H-like HicB family nuclease
VRSIPVVLEGGKPNWSGYIPSLPGCVAAADTIEETLLLLREGIALHLESMAEDGEDIPEEFRHDFSLDVQIAAE